MRWNLAFIASNRIANYWCPIKFYKKLQSSYFEPCNLSIYTKLWIVPVLYINYRARSTE